MKRALFLALLLFIAACTRVTTPQANVHAGTAGLVMMLDPTTPPQKVFAGDTFSITGTITNDGTSNVDNGMLSVGIEDDFVTTEAARRQTLRLFGRSALEPRGEMKTLRLDFQTRELPAVTQTVTTTVLLSMCYPYTTSASATICLDTDLENRVINKPCKATPISLGGGQGAPIAVSLIEPSMKSHADKSLVIPTFSITIDNIGGGQVIPPDKVAEACSGREVKDTNKALVRAYLVDKELTCAKEGAAMVTFEPGRNIVRCNLPDGIERARGAFNSLLRVEVSYGYTTTMTRQVEVVRGR